MHGNITFLVCQMLGEELQTIHIQEIADFHRPENALESNDYGMLGKDRKKLF